MVLPLSWGYRQRRRAVGQLEHDRRVHDRRSRRHLCVRRHLHLDRADCGQYQLRSSLGQSTELYHRPGHAERSDDHQHPRERHLELGRWIHRCPGRYRQRRRAVGQLDHDRRVHDRRSRRHLRVRRHVHPDRPNSGEHRLHAGLRQHPQTFTVAQATPSAPTITNIPPSATWSSGGGFTATLGNTDSDGVQSVTSSTTGVCTASGLDVTYVTAGTCTLTAQTAASTNYAAASGSPQSFTIGQATPSAPTITNIPGERHLELGRWIHRHPR